MRWLDNYLEAKLSKLIKTPKFTVYLTARPEKTEPVYVILHNVKDNTWDVKTTETVDEARAYVGADYEGEIMPGDTISVQVGRRRGFWEKNWYKFITAGAVMVGIGQAVR